MDTIVNKDGELLTKLSVVKEGDEVLWIVNYQQPDERILAIFKNQQFADYVAEAVKKYQPQP